MTKKIIGVFCAVCAIILFIVLGVVSHINKSVPKNPVGTVGNTPGNLYNGGIFCENNGIVYFSNPYDNGALYSMNPDETNIKRMMATNISSINADGKYLYYYQNGTVSDSGLGSLLGASGIFRMQKTNPSNSVCLDRVPSKYVILADNDVYYVDGGEASTKKVSTDGKVKDTLSSVVLLPACAYNSAFYYPNGIENLHLTTLDLRTKSSRQLTAEDIYMPIVTGNIVYGIDIHDNYSLVSLNTSDGSKTLLDNVKTDLLNVTDSYIYYQTSGDMPQLRRIRRDGSGMEVVAEGTYTNINATSEYLYFSAFGSSTPVYRTPVSGPLSVSTFDAAARAAADAANKK